MKKLNRYHDGWEFLAICENEDRRLTEEARQRPVDTRDGPR